MQGEGDGNVAVSKLYNEQDILKDAAETRAAQLVFWVFWALVGWTLMSVPGAKRFDGGPMRTNAAWTNGCTPKTLGSIGL